MRRSNKVGKGGSLARSKGGIELSQYRSTPSTRSQHCAKALGENSLRSNSRREQESLNKKIVEAELADGVAPASGSIGPYDTLRQPADGQNKNCPVGLFGNFATCFRATYATAEWSNWYGFGLGDALHDKSSFHVLVTKADLRAPCAAGQRPNNYSASRTTPLVGYPPGPRAGSRHPIPSPVTTRIAQRSEWYYAWPRHAELLPGDGNVLPSTLPTERRKARRMPSAPQPVSIEIGAIVALIGRPPRSSFVRYCRTANMPFASEQFSPGAGPSLPSPAPPIQATSWPLRTWRSARVPGSLTPCRFTALETGSTPGPLPSRAAVSISFSKH